MRIARTATLALVGTLVMTLMNSCSNDPKQRALSQGDVRVEYAFDTLSWAIGYSTGTMFSENSITLDYDNFKKGFSAGLNGTDSLSNADLQRIIGGYFEKQHKARMEHYSVLSERFLDSMRGQEGIVEDTASGLLYRVVKTGSDKRPSDTSFIQVDYTGYLPDGTIFDACSETEPATLQLSRVIKGWSIGLQQIGEGGEIELYIPPMLGYGPSGSGPIPPQSALKFRVSLHKVLTQQEYVASQQGAQGQ